MTREQATDEAAKILAEHIPYQLGRHGKDQDGNCKLLIAIAEAIMKGR